MSQEFLVIEQLELNKAGYLISNVSSKPVTHDVFVAQQKAAEYTVKLAAAIEGKTFKASEVDSLEAIKAEVKASINSTSVKSYVAAPAKPKSEVKEELLKFALDYTSFEEDTAKTAKINEMMNKFNKINDVQELGEYFTEGLVKLNKIYTIAEILKAVTALVPVLG
jgi:hypothetical protein